MKPLSGAHIVVTRPAGRGDSLCARIAGAGGEALPFPVIGIQPLPAPTLPAGSPDWVIFASIAAVEHGLDIVRQRFGDNVRVAAIGDATAAALRDAGCQVDIVPERHETEGLLEHPAFAKLRGLSAWIVRGRGGRELMPQALHDRGAEVSLVMVYERIIPTRDVSPLLARWREGTLDAIIVSSRAGLENLHAMLDAEGRAFLRDSQLVMPTERMLKLALDLDIRRAPVIADGASDDAFLAALLAWWPQVHERVDTPQDSR